MNIDTFDSYSIYPERVKEHIIPQITFLSHLSPEVETDCAQGQRISQDTICNGSLIAILLITASP